MSGISTTRSQPVSFRRPGFRGRAASVRTVGAEREPVGPSSGRHRFARVVAAGVLIALGLRYPLPMGLSVGVVLAAVLMPFWWSSLRRYSGARLMVAGGAAAIVSQVWLTEFSSIDHQVNTTLLVSSIGLVGGIAVGAGVVLWGRELMSDAWVATWFAAGMFLNVVVLPQGSLFSTNIWKFGFSTSVTILALVLARRFGGRGLELVTLVGLIAASAVNDARSSFAILIVALLLSAIQLRPDRASRRASTARLVIAAAGISIIVFNIGQSLILNGYLGDATQQRSIEQIDTSGSLILGGRPEIAATLALMENRPIGFGGGTIPTLGDVLVAKTGMAAIGYQPNNGYVENYMFGGRFELHSVIGDLWASAGIPGLVFAGILAYIAIRGLAVLLARNAASAIVLYLATWFFWNLLFSPLYGSLLFAILFLGLVLPRKVNDPLPRSASQVPQLGAVARPRLR